MQRSILKRITSLDRDRKKVYQLLNLYRSTAILRKRQLIGRTQNLTSIGGKCLKMQDIRHLTQHLSGR